jgi:hypothetical protein
MAAAAATAVFEIDDIAAGLTDKQLQNISSNAGNLTAPAKTLSPVHRSLHWNNIACPCIAEVHFHRSFIKPCRASFSGTAGLPFVNRLKAANDGKAALPV